MVNKDPNCFICEDGTNPHSLINGWICAVCDDKLGNHWLEHPHGNDEEHGCLAFIKFEVKQDAL